MLRHYVHWLLKQVLQKLASQQLLEASTKTMAQLTDEPVKQLLALQDTIYGVKCNKINREYFTAINSHLAVLIPAMEQNISSFIQAAAFGETLKKGQLKSLQEFSAAIHAITLALGGQGPPSSSSGGGSSSSSSSSLSGSGIISGRKPVLPVGMSTMNPDSYFHTKESLVRALSQLHAAFKSSHPALAKALSLAKNEMEDVGLFESM